MPIYDFNDASDPSLSTPLQLRFDRAAAAGTYISRVLHLRQSASPLEPDEYPDPIDWKYEL